MTNNVTYEYAIELPGQGWLHVFTPASYGAYSIADSPVSLGCDLAEVQETLRRARNFYARIGAESVGAQLRLMRRSHTVVRSDWLDAETGRAGETGQEL